MSVLFGPHLARSFYDLIFRERTTPISLFQLYQTMFLWPLVSRVHGLGGSPNPSLSVCPLNLQLLSSMRAGTRLDPHTQRSYKSFSNATNEDITSTDSEITAKRPGEVFEAELRLLSCTTVLLAVLVLVFKKDDAEGEVVATMLLDDGVVNVGTRSASLLTVGAVLPLT